MKVSSSLASAAIRIGRRFEVCEDRRAPARVVEHLHRCAARAGRKLPARIRRRGQHAHEGAQLQTRRASIRRYSAGKQVTVEIEKCGLPNLQLDYLANYLSVAVSEWLPVLVAEAKQHAARSWRCLGVGRRQFGVGRRAEVDDIKTHGLSL